MIDRTPYLDDLGYTALEACDGGLAFLDKLDRDTELTDVEKLNFLDGLAAYTEGDIKDYCSSWWIRNDKKFLGAPYSETADPHFFRINDIGRFNDWISGIVSVNISGILDDLINGSDVVRANAFEALLELPMRDDIAIDSRLLRRYVGDGSTWPATVPVLREAKTAEWMEWSSPLPPDEPDLFDLPKLSEIDCRAGLSANKSDDKIVYKHDIAECSKVRRPTVFDAEFYNQFEPGGKTIPLAECAGLGGFDEYVHTPNRFKSITEPPKFVIK